MNRLVETREIIIFLSFVISTGSLFISYTHFEAVAGTQAYQTSVVLALLAISLTITVSYGIYLAVKAIKTWQKF